MLKIIDKEDTIDSKTKSCCLCGSIETYQDSNGNKHWSNHYDEKGKFTGKSICNKCRNGTGEKKRLYKEWYDDIKRVKGCRNAHIDIKSEKCKGCIGVQVCANTLGVKDLNIQNDNFVYCVDLSGHFEYGFCEVKTATFNKRDGRWYLNKIHKENFDTLLIVCMDRYDPWKNVLRIYAIPSDKIKTSTTITIYENLSIRGLRWYEEFEIDAKPFNDTYHKMDINKCPMLSRLTNL